MRAENRDAPTSADRSSLAIDTENMAYIKPVHEEGELYYAIYGSEGQPLAIAAERMLAFVVTRQHDLVPVDVH
jgi:hypothetical protein